MAFDANLVVIKKQYTDEITKPILNTAAGILSSIRIDIDRIVDMQEYEKMTSSKEVGRYVRIKKNDYMDQKRDAYHMIKVGTTRYQTFEQFASSRYAFVSISDLEDGKHTVIWFSFHSKLYRVFREFGEFTTTFAKNISAVFNCESCVLKASSLSRNADSFTLFVNGRQRMTEASKGTMTYVRDTYGIDINEVMKNVDKNMAIHYAPADYKELSAEYTEAVKRRGEWEENRDSLQKNDKGLMIEKKDTGSEYVEILESDNNQTLVYLRGRLDIIEKALKSDPIGSIIYFRMKDRNVESQG